MRSEVARAVACGSATWWLNAILAHTEPPDEGLAHLPGDVLGLPGPVRQSWPEAIGVLRAAGTRQVRVAIVEPGDPAGVPGPAEVSALAVAAGAAIVTDGLTLVPQPGGWRALASTPLPPLAPLGTLSEARTLMRESMHTLTTAFPGLDPDDEALAGLGAYREFRTPIVPRGIDPRAGQVATDALRVWWLCLLAADLCARRDHPVPDELRRLRPAARRAASVAFSAPARLG